TSDTPHAVVESGSVLADLARGWHAGRALLALTGGEGGQNELGPEQAPQWGLIRTQELLGAYQSQLGRLFGAKIILSAFAARQREQGDLGVQSPRQIGQHRA